MWEGEEQNGRDNSLNRGKSDRRRLLWMEQILKDIERMEIQNWTDG